MEKVKVLGLVIGIIGLAILFIFLISDLTAVYDEHAYERWEANLFSISAILSSIAFTLGATAIVFYMDKRAAYFMALSTIIGATGFAPLIQRYSTLQMNVSTLIFGVLIVMVPMLASTILFAIPTKQQKDAGTSS